MKYSIVIPTYNHCTDLLIPCIESIQKFSSMDNIELIVVANGCTDNTLEYLQTKNVKTIVSVDALGYTKATNLGIKQSTGDYIVLMNNDLVLLEQPMNHWLDLLVAPFDSENVGITGPVKFDWVTGGNTFECLAFWLVMVKREVFYKIGMLDEIYSPGMGEDGDFCIRTTRAGYTLVSVPQDVKGHFDTGIVNQYFPIYHVGNGTFSDNNAEKDAVIERNNKILAEKFGKNSESNAGKWVWHKDVDDKLAYGDTLTYSLGAEFLNDCELVEDWGCGTCFMSTVLDPKVIYVGVDGSYSKFANRIVDLATYRTFQRPDGIFMRHVIEHNTQWKQILENAVASFNKKMVLVIFTPINATQTTTLSRDPTIGVPDISFSLVDLLSCLSGLKFNVEEVITDTVYGKEHVFYIERSEKVLTTSIVVPTYNHLDDALAPCLDAMLAYTDLTDKEIIVVANGCTDGTRAYLKSKPEIRTIWLAEPCGYVRAVNWGIASSSAPKIVTNDNDSILMPQQVDSWINILAAPFSDDTVGATSPFANEYTDLDLILHSGCAMYDAVLLKRLGMFDEAFQPGYFTDVDVAMKIWRAGYKCIEVPVRQADRVYNDGMFRINFPVVHTGHVQTLNKHADVEIVKRLHGLIYSRYGKKKYSIVIPTYNHCDDLLKPCIDSIKQYTALANVEIIVVANGCVDNTREYLDNLDIPVKVVWIDEGIGYTRATNAGINAATGEYIILLNNDTQFLGQNTNDWINRLQEPFTDPNVGVTGVLELHDPSADHDFLVFFCVMIKRTVFDKIGILDEIFSPGFGEDIDFCIRATRAGFLCVGVDPVVHEETRSYTTFPIWHKNNKTFGEMPEYGSEIVVRNSKVLEQRYGKNMKKYSIVIPTYNHCADLLQPLCESIQKYTDLSNVEVIIVANGCTDNTRDYVESLGSPFKLIWSEEAIGYTKATNLGIKECVGEYVVLLNNDTELLPQTHNQWLNMMVEKFTDNVGMVGPLELFDTYSNHHVLIFFCVMIKKSVFDEVGLLDEIYSPGGGEDIDFTIRVKQAGYKSVAIASSFSATASTNVGNVPIWHKDNQTFKDIPEYTKVIVKTNGLLNCRRYNNNLKLNIGAGGIDYPGFLSVDLYDKRALIKMDITKLDFPDNSATELMASHVFEHLNPYHSVDILADWLRVLKPGGKLSMEMPDIEKSCRSFLEKTDYFARMGVINVIYGSVNTTGEGGPDNITAPHLFGWWPESMFNHLQQAGYVDISFPSEKWPHPGDNFRVEAYKPTLKIDHDSLLNQEPMTYKEIFIDNSYGLDATDVRGKQVIDVGGNLGMFALACVEKGAARVICVEAQPIIYNLGLLNNIKSYPMITPLNYAMTELDGQHVHILNEHVGSKVGGDVGELVETISLSTLLYQQNALGNDLVLKLDCEGSEFNILMGSDIETIRRFNTIFIEIHNDTNSNPAYKDSAIVMNRLQEAGFNKVKDGQIVGFTTGGDTLMGVYVQKWVRV